MYVRLLSDMSCRQRILRWAELPDGSPVPGAPFVRGEVYDGPVPVYLPVSAAGPDVDFSFGFQDMPVVRRPLAQAIVEVARGDIQVVDAVIDEKDTDFVILNAIKLVDCIDEARSVTEPLLDAQRAAGRTVKYRMVANVHLRYDRIEGAEFFRLAEWPMALIASDGIVDVLKKYEATGVRWDSV